MSAWVKIPLQLLILTTGVLVFVFYLFQTPPMLFNRAYDAQIAAGPRHRRAPGCSGPSTPRSRRAATPRAATTATRSWPATRA
jgi:hypothetical protein